MVLVLVLEEAAEIGRFALLEGQGSRHVVVGLIARSQERADYTASGLRFSGLRAAPMLAARAVFMSYVLNGQPLDLRSSP
jgi:hypothetical protein